MALGAAEPGPARGPRGGAGLPGALPASRCRIPARRAPFGAAAARVPAASVPAVGPGRRPRFGGVGTRASVVAAIAARPAPIACPGGSRRSRGEARGAPGAGRPELAGSRRSRAAPGVRGAAPGGVAPHGPRPPRDPRRAFRGSGAPSPRPPRRSAPLPVGVAHANAGRGVGANRGPGFYFIFPPRTPRCLIFSPSPFPSPRPPRRPPLPPARPGGGAAVRQRVEPLRVGACWGPASGARAGMCGRPRAGRRSNLTVSWAQCNRFLAKCRRPPDAAAAGPPRRSPTPPGPAPTPPHDAGGEGRKEGAEGGRKEGGKCRLARPRAATTGATRSPPPPRTPPPRPGPAASPGLRAAAAPRRAPGAAAVRGRPAVLLRPLLGGSGGGAGPSRPACEPPAPRGCAGLTGAAHRGPSPNKRTWLSSRSPLFHWGARKR